MLSERQRCNLAPSRASVGCLRTSNLANLAIAVDHDTWLSHCYRTPASPLSSCLSPRPAISMSPQLVDPPAPASAFSSLKLDTVASKGVDYPPTFTQPKSTAEFLVRAKEVAELLALDVAEVSCSPHPGIPPHDLILQHYLSTA